MKVVKIVYDKASKYIIDLFDEFEDEIMLELYNYDSKQKKDCIPILTKYGAREKPLIVFENEMGEYAAHWAESNEDITPELIRKYLNAD